LIFPILFVFNPFNLVTALFWAWLGAELATHLATLAVKCYLYPPIPLKHWLNPQASHGGIMARFARILSFCALSLIFSEHAFADEVTLFSQPLADTLINGQVPTSLSVGLALCLGCSLNPLAASVDIGPFGPITAQDGSETFTVGPSNPAFAPIVAALQGPSPTQPPFLEFVPYVNPLNVDGQSQFLDNGYGVGTVKVLSTGTIQSLSIQVPKISKFEEVSGGPGNPLWVAIGPNGKQVYVSWEAQGHNLVPEPSPVVLLGCGMSFVAGLLALKKLSG
jgi:hypothetical protein